MAEIMNWLMGTSISGILTGLVYLAIAFLLVLAVLKCIVPVVQSRNILNRAIRRIKRNEDKDIWQDKFFLGKGALMNAWVSYLNSRLFANDEYHNASPMDDYINEDSVIYDPGFATFSEAIPGMLVSLGFLGTLIGISMGLGDFNMANTTETMNTIRQLISGMRYAFTTSIVGVVGSIGFNLLNRWVQGSARKSLNRFYDTMQHQAHMVTVDPLTQITIYQQEQTVLLNTLTEDITGNLANRVGGAVSAALSPLQESLDNFISLTTRQQVKGLEAIVARFVNSMDEALEGRFQELSDAIGETCRWQREASATSRATIDGLNRVSRDIVQIQQMSESLIVKFDAYISRLGAAQKQVDEGYLRVGDQVKGMEVVARQQANYIAQIGQMQSDFAKEVNSFRTTMEAFMTKFVDNANISASALKKVSDEIRLSGEGLKDGHKEFVKATNDELTHAFGMFDANMQDIISQLTYVINSIRESVEGMPRAIDQATGAFEGQMHQLAHSMDESRRMLDEVVRRTGGVM